MVNQIRLRNDALLTRGSRWILKNVVMQTLELQKWFYMHNVEEYFNGIDFSATGGTSGNSSHCFGVMKKAWSQRTYPLSRLDAHVWLFNDWTQ